MKALAWICIAGVACAAPPAGANEPDIAKWQSLDTSLESVVSGGFWKRDQVDGAFRVLVLREGWEHVGTRVMLQWVRRDADKQDLVVEKTVPITEIAPMQWRVTDVKFVRAKDKWQIRLPVMNIEGTKSTFTITPEPDHTYRITSGK